MTTTVLLLRNIPLLRYRLIVGEVTSVLRGGKSRLLHLVTTRSCHSPDNLNTLTEISREKNLSLLHLALPLQLRRDTLEERMLERERKNVLRLAPCLASQRAPLPLRSTDTPLHDLSPSLSHELESRYVLGGIAHLVAARDTPKNYQNTNTIIKIHSLPRSLREASTHPTTSQRLRLEGKKR